jgi:hypothetical protein
MDGYMNDFYKLFYGNSMDKSTVVMNKIARRK